MRGTHCLKGWHQRQRLPHTMAPSASVVSDQPTKPYVSRFVVFQVILLRSRKVDLFKSTYTFDGTEFPAPWPTRVDNQKSPIYALGWLVQAENAWGRRIPTSYSDYRDYVLAPKWAALGYDTEENNRDGYVRPLHVHRRYWYLIRNVVTAFQFPMQWYTATTIY
jgi:hypothetical protein